MIKLFSEARTCYACARCQPPAVGAARRVRTLWHKVARREHGARGARDVLARMSRPPRARSRLACTCVATHVACTAEHALAVWFCSARAAAHDLAAHARARLVPQRDLAPSRRPQPRVTGRKHGQQPGSGTRRLRHVGSGRWPPAHASLGQLTHRLGRWGDAGRALPANGGRGAAPRAPSRYCDILRQQPDTLVLCVCHPACLYSI